MNRDKGWYVLAIGAVIMALTIVWGVAIIKEAVEQDKLRETINNQEEHIIELQITIIEISTKGASK